MPAARYPAHPAARRHAQAAVAIAALVYAASLAVLLRQPDASLAEPLFLLLVLGIAFPALAWALTRRRGQPTPAAADAPARIPALLAYLALFALLVLGWGFSAIDAAFPDGPAQSVARLLLKWATMVVLPLWLFARATAPGPFRTRRLLVVFVVMSLAYGALQAVFGRGLTTLAELDPAMTTLAWAIPACWLWQVLEAGLAEEVLFRRVLQEKLALATGSHVAAVVWASLLFGLAHAPGLWLRGGHLMEGAAQVTPGWALAYSVAMVAPAGIAFGVLWARTRSLWLVVLLHGSVDLLPQLAPFIRAWTGT